VAEEVRLVSEMGLRVMMGSEPFRNGLWWGWYAELTEG